MLFLYSPLLHPIFESKAVIIIMCFTAPSTSSLKLFPSSLSFLFFLLFYYLFICFSCWKLEDWTVWSNKHFIISICHLFHSQRDRRCLGSRALWFPLFFSSLVWMPKTDWDCKKKWTKRMKKRKEKKKNSNLCCWSVEINGGRT